MRQVLARRPSPSLAISIVALFVALGGSAYAASKVGTDGIKDGAIAKKKLRKGAVATGKIRKRAVNTARLHRNAVTTVKIRNSAITTEKIRGGAVTGDKIDESTLGQVPSAASAVHAEDAASAGSATDWSRYGTSGLRRAGVGQTIELASVGPFTFHGRCTELGIDDHEAASFVTTSAPESFMLSSTVHHDEADFEPGMEASLELGIANTSARWAATTGEYGAWTATSPDGSLILRGFVSQGVHVFGADCAFQLGWREEA